MSCSCDTKTQTTKPLQRVSDRVSAHGFPAVGGGSTAVAHRSQFNSPVALTGTRQEVQEKTVYIYMTHQHFGEVCTWTSEAGMTDLFFSSSSTADIY